MINTDLKTALLEYGLPVEFVSLWGVEFSRLLSAREAGLYRQLCREVPDQLSGRELDTLRLLGSGLSNKQIARALGVTQHTVKNHLYAVYRALGAEDRVQAVLIALKNGLI